MVFFPLSDILLPWSNDYPKCSVLQGPDRSIQICLLYVTCLCRHETSWDSPQMCTIQVCAHSVLDGGNLLRSAKSSWPCMYQEILCWELCVRLALEVSVFVGMFVWSLYGGAGFRVIAHGPMMDQWMIEFTQVWENLCCMYARSALTHLQVNNFKRDLVWTTWQLHGKCLEAQT